MTTSGTAGFNLPFSEIAEEAYERCGKEMRTGYDLRTARRSLNLLTIEWANKGINLWLIEQGMIPLVEGVFTYDLPIDTIDLIDHVVRTNADTLNQADLSMSRISVDTYSTIPNKNSRGRPLQVWIDRQSGASYPTGPLTLPVIEHPKVVPWPVPDQSNWYQLVYWRLRRIQDAGNGQHTEDIPFRFLPALIAGLAYYLSLKVPGASDRTPGLKAMYDEAFNLAGDEDREKATLRVVPHIARV